MIALKKVDMGKDTFRGEEGKRNSLVLRSWNKAR